MREVLFILAAILLLGCAAPEEPEEPAPVVVTPPEEDVRQCNGPVCGSDGITYDTDCDALDANVQSFTIGACVYEEPDCEETDDAIESSVAGSVTKGNETYDDYCANSSVLIEYACVGKEIKNSSIECEGMCIDGECVELEPEIDETCQGPLGPDTFVRETVTVAGVNYTDTCIDFTTVKDFYCKDNNVSSTNTNCAVGYRCDGGKCVLLEVSCHETDDGFDIENRGKTTQSLGLATTFDEWDECVDEGMLKEHYCVLNGTAVSELVECGSGKKCVVGRCIESDCYDTDGGFDIYKKGTATFHDEEYEDDCISDEKLREYYCYGDSIESDDVQCPEDYFCDRSRCVEGYRGSS